MPESDNAAYYQQRRLASLKIAEAATDPNIAQLHRQFADRYAQAARAQGSRAQTR